MATSTISRRTFGRNPILAIAGAIILLFGASFILGTRLAGTPSPAPLASPIAPSASGEALVTPPQPVDDFTLTSHTGDPISLSDLRGQPVLMFFGYTHCPDVCPGTLAEYAQARRMLGERGDDVSFVFISVDGDRDTPGVLASYLANFDASFIGMTGDEATLRAFGDQYGLAFQAEREDTGGAGHDDHGGDHHHDEAAEEDYFVGHTSPSFLIDADGLLQRVYFYGSEAETIAAGLSRFLPEQSL